MSDDTRDRPADGERWGTGARIALGAAVGLGALASGLLLTRPGRRLVRDVFGGKRRSELESRLLEDLWEDRVLGKRSIEVTETAPGRVRLTGTVGSREEADRALALAERTVGVAGVEEALVVATP